MSAGIGHKTRKVCMSSVSTTAVVELLSTSKAWPTPDSSGLLLRCCERNWQVQTLAVISDACVAEGTSGDTKAMTVALKMTIGSDSTSPE